MYLFQYEDVEVQWLNDNEVATTFGEGDLGDGDDDDFNVGATTTGTDIRSDGSFGHDD